MRKTTKLKLLIAAAQMAPAVQEMAKTVKAVVTEKASEVTKAVKDRMEDETTVETGFDQPMQLIVAGVSKENTKVTKNAIDDGVRVTVVAKDEERDLSYFYEFTVPKNISFDVKYNDGMLFFTFNQVENESVEIEL